MNDKLMLGLTLTGSLLAGSLLAGCEGDVIVERRRRPPPPVVVYEPAPQPVVVAPAPQPGQPAPPPGAVVVQPAAPAYVEEGAYVNGVIVAEPPSVDYVLIGGDWFYWHPGLRVWVHAHRPAGWRPVGVRVYHSWAEHPMYRR